MLEFVLDDFRRACHDVQDGMAILFLDTTSLNKFQKLHSIDSDSAPAFAEAVMAHLSRHA